MYKYLLIYILCTISGSGFSQETSLPVQTVTDTTDWVKWLTEEYSLFKLPPLQTLLEDARINNPQVLQNNANIEAAQYDLKIERRKWLSYLSARAGYTYGILGTYSDYESRYDNLTTTYTGSSQHSYSVGANLTIPINDLVSRGTSVKRQRKIIEQAEYSREVVYNMLKIEIIELYTDIQSLLAILQRQSETLITFDANYKITVNNFINGKATPYDLSVVKNEQTKALAEYESTRAKLTSLILRLEIITGSKIVNK